MNKFLRVVSWIAIMNTLSGCLASLEDTLGSNAPKFPQYSGTYHLTSITDQSLKKNPKQLQPPKHLKVTHRMEWKENFWDHQILFQAIDVNAGEAPGGFSAPVSGLIRRGAGCLATKGPCEFSGTSFKSMKIPLGGGQPKGAFCKFYGYEYLVDTVGTGYMIPDPELLDKIYWNYEKEPSLDYHMRLMNPEKATIDVSSSEEWYSQVSKNHGYRIALTLSKKANTAYAGCSDGIPLDDNDGDTGSMTLVYDMDEAQEAQHTDLRKASPGAASGGNLFDQLTAFL